MTPSTAAQIPGNDRAIREILIVGGGSAGWMTAAALSHQMPRGVTITLVESEDIGTVGVGEATIPPIRLFNQTLGIDEREFMKRTQASYKLGIEFVNWGSTGNRYFHPFGPHGKPMDILSVHQHWLIARANGDLTPFDQHSMAWALATASKFSLPGGDPRNVMSTFDYAFHFDAGLYAKYLREVSEARGVRRVEGKIASVEQHPETGYVTGVQLEDGRVLNAELFIDCSGFRGLLIEGALKTGYHDWTHWLPCDRAIAVPCAKVEGGFTPYTRSTAHAAGWQWRIPLQHRTGNGHVFCSAHMEEQEALDILLSGLDGAPMAEPNRIRFQTGMRRQFWTKNVIAIGLSSGFLEPLESTSLHLIQAGISKLLALFPTRDFDDHVRDEFNHLSATEFERIRDFIILHYKLSTRDDSAFWQYCRDMDVPDTVAQKITHFKTYGRHIPRDLDLFGAPSWLAVHLGQGNVPDAPDPMAHYGVAAADGTGAAYLAKLRSAMAAEAAKAPTHEAFVAQHVAAYPPKITA
jgi:tryptophan 7-halogenase